jgi:hypothetical protein
MKTYQAATVFNPAVNPRFPWKSTVNGVIFAHCQTQEDAIHPAQRAIEAIENRQELEAAERKLRELRGSDDLYAEGRSEAMNAAKTEIMERRNKFVGINVTALLAAIQKHAIAH